MEKRRAGRHKKRLNIKFGVQHPDLIGFLVDISATGLRIKTNHVFRPGTKLKMTIKDKDVNMHAEGLVTWARKVPLQMMNVTRCGMGVTFLRIDANLANYFTEHDIN